MFDRSVKRPVQQLLMRQLGIAGLRQWVLGVIGWGRCVRVRYQANNPQAVATNPARPPRPTYNLQLTTKTLDTPNWTHRRANYTWNETRSKMLIWVGVLADMRSLITLIMCQFYLGLNFGPLTHVALESEWFSLVDTKGMSNLAYNPV